MKEYEKYDWFRVETTKHGSKIACGGIFPVSEIKEFQIWEGVGGHKVTIDKVSNQWIDYSWTENGEKKAHRKEPFAFQCRYCLVLSSNI